MSIAATGITRWLPCIRAGAASPAPPGTWVILACQHSPVSTPVKAGATDKAGRTRGWVSRCWPATLRTAPRARGW